MSENPTFILAGNGPYDNRGCEAIVRGTAKILRHYYKDPSFLCVSFFQNQEQFEKQRREEFDPAIVHKKANKRQSKFDPNWLLRLPFRRLYPELYKNWMYKEMIPYIENSNSVLSVGGDNYSLDYGIPRLFTYLDDVVLERKKPLIIWGASVGPFEKIPEYEKYIKKHLQNVTGIFAREPATIEYLDKIGITDNVYKVADPAFLMDPTEPQSNKKIEIEEDSIGINLSSLMARYLSNGNMELWINKASTIVEEIAKRTDNKIYLIPHVTLPDSNDYLFLKEVKERIKTSEEKIILLPPTYNASETKWIISKMKLFAGARTHSTIAALSSYVPTLSFAYSIKAKGINRDIFGHEDYCLNPEKLNPEIVAEKIESMLEKGNEIRAELKAVIPKIENEALLAGKTLMKITG
ncbi:MULTISPECIES: polysaccharide pyruvyl transferase family protein [unclassified Methanosarcina]|uniref:polysaccharide pyruvyl transferase family protein n=1 Tax=unclassified Methanosarcina TaxID=2644672 RepID=UPI000621FE48|nr:MULTISPECIES: polysaccharide pyruvyl transferase family protein [unclassified Methanosarcina]KKG09439.1 polysaccharide pyruvyl transferase [Methanosarcina sp. 2.H.A.1B.4]KKH48337.1 polysaccharide pyruvyl transferase [Methanosarcina sp. 1.H.A.2.2]